MGNRRKEGIDASESEIRRVLEPKEVMQSYESQGGTGGKPVKEMLGEFNQRLSEHRASLGADQERVSRAYEACRTIARDAKQVRTTTEFDALVEKAFKKVIPLTKHGH